MVVVERKGLVEGGGRSFRVDRLREGEKYREEKEKSFKKRFRIKKERAPNRCLLRALFE